MKEGRYLIDSLIDVWALIVKIVMARAFDDIKFVRGHGFLKQAFPIFERLGRSSSPSNDHRHVDQLRERQDEADALAKTCLPTPELRQIPLSRQTARYEDDASKLDRKVSNPVPFMISVPVHPDFDFGRWSEGNLFSLR